MENGGYQESFSFIVSRSRCALVLDSVAHGALRRKNLQRFLRNIDVNDADSRQQVLNVIDILHKQACRVVVDPPAEAGSPVANFLEELRAQPSLHFD